MKDEYRNDDPDEQAEQEQRLLHQIETVLANPEAESIEDEMGAFIHWLTQAQPVANERFQQQLREQLLAESHKRVKGKKMKVVKNQLISNKYITRRQAWAALIFGAACLAVIILFSPPGRAWAKAILAQSGLVIITDDPTLPELMLTQTPEPTPTKTSSIPPQEDNGDSEYTWLSPENDLVDPVAISELVGFTVLIPDYVPDGYELLRFQPLQGRDGTFYEVSSEYSNLNERDGYFLLRQIYVSPEDNANTFEWPVGDAPVVELMVRGQPGVWVEQSNQGQTTNEAGEAVLSQWNMLLWQEDDFSFWFFSKNLPQEEMVKIAESLSSATEEATD